MFSSLNRIDIECKPGPGGRPFYFQMDERSFDEVAKTLPLSILFAVFRILNAA